tara:strand:+ start:270 stop:1538 length:1269 start_codon:yes stop_codon:yes gene_type:complete
MHKNLKALWLPYTQMSNIGNVPKALKTSKNKIYLDNGNYLLDGISSWWTACHGYNNAYIRKKVINQLNIMPHIMFGGLVHDQAITLSKRLINILNNELKKVFFSDSGSVSVEIALKMSIQYWINKGQKKKTKFVFFKNGYHGDTAATMSICDPDEGMHSIFKGHLKKNYMLNLPENNEDKNKFENFIKKNEDKIAAIIVEPLVQSAGGMKFHSINTLNFIDKIRNKKRMLLIYDEIATGFYRTGSMFAFQQTKTIPDILCIGKALTGGFMSLAATIANEKIFNAFLSKKKGKEFMHGPTYMANPLSCSAANASLDIFRKKNFTVIVKRIENIMNSNLKKFIIFKQVKDIRVKGAIGVIEVFKLTNERKEWIKKEFIKNKVWLRPLRNVIYFMPPLSTSEKDLKIMIEVTYKVFKKWEKIEKK